MSGKDNQVNKGENGAGGNSEKGETNSSGRVMEGEEAQEVFEEKPDEATEDKRENRSPKT